MKIRILLPIMLFSTIAATPLQAIADTSVNHVKGNGYVKGKGAAHGSGVVRGKGTASGSGVVIYRDQNGQIRHKRGTGTVTGKGIAIGRGTAVGKGRAAGQGHAAGKGRFKK